MFDQGGQAFHPVAIIAVQNPIHFAHFRFVDMTADHAIVVAAPGFVDDQLLVGGDEGDCILHLVLEVLRQRPVAKTEAVAGAVEPVIQHQDEGVQLVAQIGQPLGVLDDPVVLIAMRDPQAPSVGSQMLGFKPDFDAAEELSVVLAGELIVVAWDIDDTRSLAYLAQQLLQHIVVGLWPVPALLQSPAIDDVAHQIHRIRIMAAKEIKKALGLTPCGAKMDIGNPDAAVAHDGSIGV